MPEITDKLNIFLIPPILFLITGVSLGLFSLLKGKRQYENILFALICFWYSLLMPAFISHHFLTGDIPLIMKIERFIHFFYVFGPAILVLFVHTIVNKKNRFIEIGAFVIASIISLFVFTDYYFYGMWEYQWGYIAKGGIVLQLFGIFAMSSIVYALVLSIKKLKTGIDHHTSLKIKFIMFAILFIGILTIGNMPALNGIGIYPPGNFAFIPILFMAWGIFRYDAIRINLYTRRRIAGAAVKILVTAALSAVIPVSFWAMGNSGLSDIAEKIIPHGIPPLLSFFCCVFLSFLSLRMGENRPDSITFSLLMLVYALLSIDIFLNCIITVPETGLRVSRFSHIFVVFIPPLAMNLTHIVTKRQSGRRLLYGNYLISIILLLFSQSPYYLKGMHIYSWGMFAEKGVMFNIMSIVSALTLAYCIIVLFDVYRKNDNPYYRNRFLFLLIGFASIAVLSMGNIPAMSGYDLYPPGNFIFIPAILFAIALFRNNISEMVRFSGKFIHFTIMTAAVFTAVRILTVRHSDTNLNLYIFSSILIILIFNYFLTRLRDAITGREFKRLKIFFEKLSDRLCRVRSIEEIAESVALSFFNYLSCSECTILIHEKNTGQYCGSYIINSKHEINRRIFTCEDSVSINVSGDNPILGYVRDIRSPVKQ